MLVPTGWLGTWSLWLFADAVDCMVSLPFNEVYLEAFMKQFFLFLKQKRDNDSSLVMVTLL
jgi:hypothetical protein